MFPETFRNFRLFKAWKTVEPSFAEPSHLRLSVSVISVRGRQSVRGGVVLGLFFAVCLAIVGMRFELFELRQLCFNRLGCAANWQYWMSSDVDECGPSLPSFHNLFQPPDRPGHFGPLEANYPAEFMMIALKWQVHYLLVQHAWQPQLKVAQAYTPRFVGCRDAFVPSAAKGAVVNLTRASSTARGCLTAAEELRLRYVVYGPGSCWGTETMAPVTNNCSVVADPDWSMTRAVTCEDDVSCPHAVIATGVSRFVWTQVPTGRQHFYLDFDVFALFTIGCRSSYAATVDCGITVDSDRSADDDVGRFVNVFVPVHPWHETAAMERIWTDLRDQALSAVRPVRIVAIDVDTGWFQTSKINPDGQWKTTPQSNSDLDYTLLTPDNMTGIEIVRVSNAAFRMQGSDYRPNIGFLYNVAFLMVPRAVWSVFWDPWIEPASDYVPRLATYLSSLGDASSVTRLFSNGTCAPGSTSLECSDLSLAVRSKLFQSVGGFDHEWLFGYGTTRLLFSWFQRKLCVLQSACSVPRPPISSGLVFSRHRKPGVDRDWWNLYDRLCDIFSIAFDLYTTEQKTEHWRAKAERFTMDFGDSNEDCADSERLFALTTNPRL
eukprot:TRINITY_DN6586_c0_g1_i2.p1 TRINITY_DN6586_c0_g1~~TRINITY_DN6586_c0_g1_i2.p1  ORF type:complete len:613 (+),score=79.33 TRINITY_DN6586_c0_g1_i2:28-1839(+)